MPQTQSPYRPESATATGANVTAPDSSRNNATNISLVDFPSIGRDWRKTITQAPDEKRREHQI